MRTGVLAYTVKADRAAGLLLLLYSVCIVLVCTSYGFLRMPYPVLDGSWYLMGGKAWMSGLTPYADFADSKGPLLWLIYGIDYLISPMSLKGMFPILILLFWATFYLLYKCACILTENRNGALVASMLMALPFFFPGMHEELRAEDLCQCFMALSLLGILKLNYQEELKFKNALWLGLACGGSFMMKYSIGLVLVVPIICILIRLLCISRLRPFTHRYIAGCLAGFLVIVLPFILYFLIIGNLNDFYSEYFQKTAETVREQSAVSNENSLYFLSRWRYRLPDLIRESRISSDYFKLSLLALSLMSVSLWRRHLSAWILIIWFGVSVLIITLINEPHYYFILAVFWLPAFSRLTTLFKTIGLAGTSIAGACMIAAMAVATNIVDDAEFKDAEAATVWQKDQEKLQTVLRLNGIMEGNTMAYWGGIDFGSHIYSGLVPGVKYWAMQEGATPVMRNDHYSSIIEKKPDVVLISATDSEGNDRLKNAGYKKIFTFNPRPDWTERYNQLLYNVYIQKSPDTPLISKTGTP